MPIRWPPHEHAFWPLYRGGGGLGGRLDAGRREPGVLFILKTEPV